MGCVIVCVGIEAVCVSCVVADVSLSEGENGQILCRCVSVSELAVAAFIRTLNCLNTPLQDFSMKARINVGKWNIEVCLP